MLGEYYENAGNIAHQLNFQRLAEHLNRPQDHNKLQSRHVCSQEGLDQVYHF